MFSQFFPVQDLPHGQDSAFSESTTTDEHKPLLYVNSAEPCLSSSNVTTSGSLQTKDREERHVHFIGSDSEASRNVRPQGSQTCSELPTKDYEVSLIHVQKYKLSTLLAELRTDGLKAKKLFIIIV